MGILGLQSVFGFSDRLFNSFDIDSDGNVFYRVKIDFIPRFFRIYGSPKMWELKQ